MPPRQQTQPESGSRTLTQTAATARDAGQNENNGGPSEPVGVLKLRGGPSRRQRVVWSEGTVDNEGMGKKKSKSRFCLTSSRKQLADEKSVVYTTNPKPMMSRQTSQKVTVITTIIPSPQQDHVGKMKEEML